MFIVLLQTCLKFLQMCIGTVITDAPKTFTDVHWYLREMVRLPKVECRFWVSGSSLSEISTSDGSWLPFNPYSLRLGRIPLSLALLKWKKSVNIFLRGSWHVLCVCVCVCVCFFLSWTQVLTFSLAVSCFPEVGMRRSHHQDPPLGGRCRLSFSSAASCYWKNELFYFSPQKNLFFLFGLFFLVKVTFFSDLLLLFAGPISTVFGPPSVEAVFRNSSSVLPRSFA